MSSQGGKEIPLSIAPEQQHFRLMELPPEVLTLLSMPSPPIMQFKSSPSGNVALCLPDKTFQLRQVQTSNSVHIIQPFSAEADANELPAPAGICAIAQCGSTLEFEATSTGSPMAALQSLLPIFSGADEDIDMDQPLSKQQIYDDIPFSEAEINESWRSLCAFESEDGVSAYQPGPKALLLAWSSIVSAATIEGIDLSSSITPGQSATITSGVERAPENLVRAIFDKLGVVADGQLLLDKQLTVLFTGQTLLRALLQAPEVDFMQQWSDLLPESWRQHASVDLLNDIRDLQAGTGMVRLQSAKPSAQSSDGKAASTTAKRKWHDKFKQSRNR